MIVTRAIFKKNDFFYIFPNLIKIKKFQEQLIILKGDYDGHFFAQGYFGSQSLHRKKSFNFLYRNSQECNTYFSRWKLEIHFYQASIP